MDFEGVEELKLAIEEVNRKFAEVDRKYPEFKRLYEQGIISYEEFDEQLKHWMIQDEQGRWWSKSLKSGEWHYYDGTTWVKDTSPSLPPTPSETAPVVERVPDEYPPRVRPGQAVQAKSTRATSLDSSPTLDQNGKRWWRRVPQGRLLFAALFCIAGAVVVAAVIGTTIWRDADDGSDTSDSVGDAAPTEAADTSSGGATPTGQHLQPTPPPPSGSQGRIIGHPPPPPSDSAGVGQDTSQAPTSHGAGVAPVVNNQSHH